MPARIPLYDIRAELREQEAALHDALSRVLGSGRFVLGAELEAFEQEFARYLGAAHTVGVNSGTDALVLALEALGVGPGDEVITTPFSFFATAEAVLRVGAVPVFADVEPETLCISPAAVARAVTARTRAVLPVHVSGHCADMDRIESVCAEHGLLLIEDACQAVGAWWRGRRLGTVGAAGCFSFYPTKNLACLGDGGAVVTGDGRVAARLRELRVHGRDETGFARAGHNSRLDELQAAFLRSRLPGLDAALDRRRVLAARYDEELPAGMRPVKGAPGCESSYHQYAILSPARDRLRSFLAERGVETGIYYPVPLHREPALAGLARVELPNAERAGAEVLCLPIRPSLTEAEQEHIINSITEFFADG